MEFITPGGKTLSFHLQNESTTQKIRDGKWNFVVLQDQSQTPALFPRKFEAAAVKLDRLIKESGAKTVFYQTWGRRDGDKINPKLFPDYGSMQKELSESYSGVSRRCDAILAPVGDTWERARKANPRLGTALYRKDGSHPSDKGAYLAACVFYATFFGKSPAGIDYRGGLPEADSDLILKTVGSPGGQNRKATFPIERTLTNSSEARIEVTITGRSRTRIYFTSRGKSHTFEISELSEEDQRSIERLPVNR